jgi:hypothetical protein
VDFDSRRARSETIISYFVHPRNSFSCNIITLLENQFNHEGRLYTGRGVVDECGLVGLACNTDPVIEVVHVTPFSTPYSLVLYTIYYSAYKSGFLDFSHISDLIDEREQ